jgi:FlaA1/EpsC-like NDP-sugar epimerase
VIGTQNVLKAALATGVKSLIYTSSDKAVNPTNVMGTSKLLAERVVTAASSNYWDKNKELVFSSTRFGNVLGSNGSVVPIFIQQIKQGGPVTVTDPEMTRFVMTIKEAADLVLKSGVYSCGGEVMVTKMPVIRILDLAEVMIELLAPVFGRSKNNIKIEYIGAKPGEKLYEELMTEEEAPRSYELPEMFSILPTFRNENGSQSFEYPEILSKNVTKPYISNTEAPMNKEELRDYLLSYEILGEELTELCRDHLHLSIATVA